MAEKIGKHEDYTSHDEKNPSPPEYNDLPEQAGRRGSVALNIVENPLKVGSKTQEHAESWQRGLTHE